MRDTAVRLAELGWLHNKIRKYADQRSLDRSFGLVGQVCSSLLGLRYLIFLMSACKVTVRLVLRNMSVRVHWEYARMHQGQRREFKRGRAFEVGELGPAL